METLLIVLHVIVCVFLMLTVLLQSGKSGGMGSAFGGGGNTASVFGGSGANPFLQKLTSWAAGIFMVTSISLAYVASKANSGLQKRSDEAALKAKAADEELKKALEQVKPTAPAAADAAAPMDLPADPAALVPGAATAPSTAPTGASPTGGAPAAAAPAAAAPAAAAPAAATAPAPAAAAAAPTPAAQ